MKTNRVIRALCAILLLSVLQPTFAALPCGNSGAGVLNVGIIPQNLPWSDYDSSNPNDPIGFDPLLIEAAAKLLGYATVNFIGYATIGAALTALNNGTIDVFADSAQTLSAGSSITYNGVVTDISKLYQFGTINGWQVALTCCDLALNLELAVTELVNNGTYAYILQQLRANSQTNGNLLGFPYGTGILTEPFPFAGSEFGSIESNCTPLYGPLSLPKVGCVGAYLQNNCSPYTTFTGATGQLIG